MTTNTQNKHFKKYPKYKNSGVEWLGDIPEHWEETRLGTILNPISERNRTDLPLLSITREKGVILRDLDNEEENHNFIPDDLSNYKVLKKGQFGMNKMKAWQGSYGIANLDGIVSPAYFIFKLAEKIISEYFHVAIRSKLYVSYFGSASDGVRIGQWDLSKDRMKQIPFLIPPFAEQQKIANFLDQKSDLLDKAISIKQKQIELLKERRQILIHNAVTGKMSEFGFARLNDLGIEKNPKIQKSKKSKFRHSGIEWIGEIPELWEVKRLKYVFDYLQTGTTPTTVNQKFFEGNVDWYNPKDLNNEILITSERKLSNLAIEKKEIKYFPKDSVLIVGIGATTGKTSYMNEKGTFNQQITGFHSSNYFNKYFFYLLNNLSKVMLYTASYTTLAILNNEFFKSFYLVVPPISEQKEIVKYIEIATEKIATAISLKEKEIEKLKEYKASLINSVC